MNKGLARRSPAVLRDEGGKAQIYESNFRH